MTRRQVAAVWAGAALVVACGSLASRCSCVETGGQADAAWDAAPTADGQADVDVGVWDARAQEDAAPTPDAAPVWDAGPLVDAVPGALIQLPPTGLNEMLGVGHEHPYVTYSEWRTADYDIFLFDLTTQAESPVCTEAGRQVGPRITNGWIFWSDSRDYSTPQSTAREIFGYEIASATTEQLTSDGFVKVFLAASETHFLYYTNEGMPANHGSATLVLESRLSGQKRFLCEYIYGPQGASLNGTHVAWSALDPTNNWSNRSVFLHDIAANDTRLLASTTPGNVWTTDLDGDWLVWSDDRFGNHDVFAYRISIELELRVTDEPHDQIVPRVGGNLVVFMDFRYTGGSFHDATTINDLVVHDLETSHWRKVTGWSARWAPFGQPQAGWQVFIRGTYQGASTYEVWAMNMVANLIVDASDHVIPIP